MILPLLLGSSALAFAPSSETYIGQEPTRLMRFHTEQQHRLRHSAAWQSFLSGPGAGWMVRFDEKTGTVYRAWGPGIALGDLSSTADAGQALLGLLSRHPDLLGVPVDHLALGTSGYDAESDTWHILLDRIVPSPALGVVAEAPIKVYRGGVQAVIKQGRLIMFSLQTHPDADAVDPIPTLSRDEALEIAVAEGPAPQASHTYRSGDLVVLPELQGSGIGYRLCYEIRSRTEAPLGEWVSYVDAHTGELINVHNEIRFFSGTITGEHDTRTVNGDMSVSALASVTVDSTSGSRAYTNASGAFSVTGDAGTVTLTGPDINVQNQQGANGALYVTGDGVFTEASATLAEIDTLVFLTDVRNWADVYAPHINSSWTRITSNVNLSSTCNAYFDGDVNFYRSGGGCNNTGRIADVNYHEWGHGFHYYNLLSGSFDGSISEGVGDSISFFLTGDATIAPYFSTGGSGIREVSSNRVYPDDWTGEVHADGLIFAGAVWDLWDELEKDRAPEDAASTLYAIFTQGMRSGPDIPGSYDAFVAGDDDDGNLGNGTPNLCALIEAFSDHGLGPGGTSEGIIEISHLPLANQTGTASDYALDADFSNLAEACLDGDLESAEVIYSTDGGDSWDSAPLELSADSIVGAIPAQSTGTIVHYYVRGRTVSGTDVTAPTGGDITPLSFYVGKLVEVYCNDFEDGDGGFSSELVSGEETAGANDWMWGTPAGLEGDPDFAYSGDNVWGNDLGGTIDGQQYNGAYQSDKHNRLLSPVIDVSAYDGPFIVQFQRWLTVEDGFYDEAVITINDKEVWSNHATEYSIGDEHHKDTQWAPHTLMVEHASDGTLQIGWEIDSDGGLEFGGWNIDDVCVYAISDADNTGGDDTGDGGEDTDPGSDGDPGVGGEKDDWSMFGCATTGGHTPTGLLAGLLALGAALTRRRRS